PLQTRQRLRDTLRIPASGRGRTCAPPGPARRRATPKGSPARRGAGSSTRSRRPLARLVDVRRQELAKMLASTVNARTYRPRWNAKDVGDLVVAASLQVAEDDRLAVLRRQLHERPLHHLVQLALGD